MLFQAVIFDRDGVLSDFDLAAANAYFGPLLPLSIEQIAVRWEVWGAEVGFPRTVEEEEVFFHGFWNVLADEYGLSQTARRQLHDFRYTTCLRPYPEAREILTAARRHGLVVGVLSNFTLASLDDSLEALGLADLVDGAFASTVIGAAKPDPAAYLTVTEALGVEPGHCLFFDDEQPCVEGARRVGITAYLIDRNRTAHSLSEGVVCDLSALTAVLAATC